MVRDGHPLTRGEVTADRYAAAGHVQVQRRGLHSADIDDAVREAGFERPIAVIVHGFSAALALARETELVATVPERHTAGLRRGMSTFVLPLAIPAFTLSMIWHPRMDGDLAHRWLRGHIRNLCAGKRGAAGDAGRR